MAVGISPELTQAAYRVGDSASNIIMPLMVFFPLGLHAPYVYPTP